MKKHFNILSLFCGLAMSACSGSSAEEIAELKAEIRQLKTTSSRQLKLLESIDTKFLRPFSAYERIVMEERSTHPDTLIRQYEAFMLKYPESFWNHEAKNRKANIVSRRSLWKNGHWDLSPKQATPEKTETLAPRTISCPEC